MKILTSIMWFAVLFVSGYAITDWASKLILKPTAIVYSPEFDRKHDELFVCTFLVEKNELKCQAIDSWMKSFPMDI